MGETDAVHRAEEIGGPSEGYERPDDLPTDDDEGYDEGSEEPSGLTEKEDEEENDDEG